MKSLPPDPFLNELHKMYERGGQKGSVYVTVKRSCLKPRRSKVLPASQRPASDFKCLVRASLGKSTISTTVPPHQHMKFVNSINVLMKAHMGALKTKKKKEAGSRGGEKQQQQQ
jgi:signal recognition particle subunit SRP14